MTKRSSRIPSLLSVCSPLFVLLLTACAGSDEKPDAPPTSTETTAEEQPAELGPAPDGTVAIDTSGLAVTPSGGMSRGAAARVALEGSPALQACYREQLRADGELSLKVDIDIAVNAEGGATMAAANGLDASRLSSEMLACLTGAIAVWPYEWPEEPVTVTYPVTFTPGR